MELVPVTREMKLAFARSPEALASHLGLPLPAGWPQFPEALVPAALQEAPPPWGGYLFASEGSIVGNGGFAGPPDEKGMVEIGYEIAPAFQGRGLATAAARALIDLAFANRASAVCAHSLAGANASNRVMQKAGMSFIAPVPNPEVGEVWRFALDRDHGRSRD